MIKSKEIARQIKSNIKENYLSIFFIVIFFAFFIFYIKFDNTPPHWDAGRHFYNSFKYWELFKGTVSKRENGITDAVSSLITTYLYYPPAGYWLTLPFLGIFGRVYRAALLVNIVWISVLSISWLNISKKLFSSKVAGQIGLLFLLGSPFLIGQSREYQLDLPALAMTFLIVWAFESLIQKFELKNFIFVGFSIGIGLLVKWLLIIYLPIIVLFYSLRFIYISYKYKNFQLSKFLAFVYVALTSIISIAGTWYIVNLTRLKLDLTKNSSAAGIAEGDPQGFTVGSFKFYANTIVNVYLWLPWLVFFVIIILIAIFLLIKNSSSLKDKLVNQSKLIFSGLFSIIYFVGILIYHVFQSNKDDRYPIVFFISFAILVGLSTEIINKLSNSKWLKNSLIVVAFVIFLANLLNMNIPKLNQAKLVLNENGTFPVIVFNNDAYTNPRTDIQQWAIENALQKAQSIRTDYVYRYDSCISKDYWDPKPTIIPDFDQEPLHSNYGTVWGLAEQYGLTIGDQNNPCFILVAQTKPLDQIDYSKYTDNYYNAGEFEDWQGFNMILMAKK
jgi:4-amino-4-deoxy-L-arabinose transferase-like glycosyltransferase